MPTAQTTDKQSFGPFGDSTKEKKIPEARDMSMSQAPVATPNLNRRHS